ncbi:MAG TPA: hypothetical protein DCZ40_05355 [Lachnospiraceae bacterium]|nr:hypothetical protein [Lachnospiraceae bacterium]
MDQQRIGRWIAFLRKEQKLTQEQLAERLGVSNRSVSRWENGRGMPDFPLLWDISRELNVSVAELLNGERAEEDVRTADGIEVLLIWAEREKQYRTKKLGKYFGAGMFCLLLALGQAQFEIAGLLFPKIPAEWMTGLLAGAGIWLEILGFSCNREKNMLTRKEVELLSKNGGIVKMKKAQEMLQFAQKYRTAEQKCHRAAFAELEKELQEDEQAVFSAVGDSYARNELPMMWYAVLAITETRILIGGQRMKGMIMVRYEVESFLLSDYYGAKQSGASVIIQTAQGELKLEEGNPGVAADIVKEMQRIIGK